LSRIPRIRDPPSLDLFPVDGTRKKIAGFFGVEVESSVLGEESTRDFRTPTSATAGSI
jgi:hypothetical protein